MEFGSFGSKTPLLADPPPSMSINSVEPEEEVRDHQFADIGMTDSFLIPSPEFLPIKHAHSGGFKAAKGAVITLAFPPFSWGYAAAKTTLIKAGHVGLSMNSGRPELLGPGWHCLLSPLRTCSKQVPVTENIFHGTIGVVTVTEGRLGFATDQGKPLLLGPGLHTWNSPTLVYHGDHDLSQPIVRIGPYTLVIVRAGSVAVCYDDGALDVRSAGFHVLRHVRHQARGFLQVTDQFDELNELQLLTADKVSLQLDATVHYAIVNPSLAALKAGDMDEIRRLVSREAVACLTASLSRSRVDDVSLLARSGSSTASTDGSHAAASSSSSSSPSPAYDATVPGAGDSAYSGRFEDKSVLFEAAVSTLAKVGVELYKIAIRRWMVKDHSISNKLAQQAVIRTNRLEKLDTADVERKTLEIQAEAQARAKVIAARADAEARLIAADARVEHGRRLAELDALLGPGHAARLDLLEATGDTLSSTASSTIFVPQADIVSALTANPSFVSSAPPS